MLRWDETTIVLPVPELASIVLVQHCAMYTNYGFWEGKKELELIPFVLDQVTVIRT